MWRLIVLGLLLAGCGGQTGIEGHWWADGPDVVSAAAGPDALRGAALVLEGGGFTAAGLERGCDEVGDYELAGVGVDPYGVEGPEVNLQPSGCGQPHALVWRGDVLWLRGEREGTFVVAFVRH